MPTPNNIGDIVVLLGNLGDLVYGHTYLPGGGTWYCSLSPTNTVDLDGHNPVVSTTGRLTFYLAGGTDIGSNLVIAYRTA